MQTQDGCNNCRFHSKEERPKPINEAGFDDLVEIADEPEVFYLCRNPAVTLGKETQEIGRIPVFCDNWQASEKDKTISEADLAMARYEARQKYRKEEE